MQAIWLSFFLAVTVAACPLAVDVSRYNVALLYTMMLATGGHARLLEALFEHFVKRPFAEWISWLEPGYGGAFSL
ncbi:MAG: hypothetical protein IPK60_20635 [Sandaracinaceae bacterium]|nr:hypothetical protein [Sandaracinaceae bacterium]